MTAQRPFLSLVRPLPGVWCAHCSHITHLDAATSSGNIRLCPRYGSCQVGGVSGLQLRCAPGHTGAACAACAAGYAPADASPCAPCVPCSDDGGTAAYLHWLLAAAAAVVLAAAGFVSYKAVQERGSLQQDLMVGGVRIMLNYVALMGYATAALLPMRQYTLRMASRAVTLQQWHTACGRDEGRLMADVTRAAASAAASNVSLGVGSSMAWVLHGQRFSPDLWYDDRELLLQWSADEAAAEQQRSAGSSLEQHGVSTVASFFEVLAGAAGAVPVSAFTGGSCSMGHAQFVASSRWSLGVSLALLVLSGVALCALTRPARRVWGVCARAAACGACRRGSTSSSAQDSGDTTDADVQLQGNPMASWAVRSGASAKAAAVHVTGAQPTQSPMSVSAAASISPGSRKAAFAASRAAPRGVTQRAMPDSSRTGIAKHTQAGAARDATDSASTITWAATRTLFSVYLLAWGMSIGTALQVMAPPHRESDGASYVMSSSLGSTQTQSDLYTVAVVTLAANGMLFPLLAMVLLRMHALRLLDKSHHSSVTLSVLTAGYRLQFTPAQARTAAMRILGGMRRASADAGRRAGIDSREEQQAQRAAVALSVRMSQRLQSRCCGLARCVPSHGFAVLRQLQNAAVLCCLWLITTVSVRVLAIGVVVGCVLALTHGLQPYTIPELNRLDMAVSCVVLLHLCIMWLARDSGTVAAIMACLHVLVLLSVTTTVLRGASRKVRTLGSAVRGRMSVWLPELAHTHGHAVDSDDDSDDDVPGSASRTRRASAADADAVLGSSLPGCLEVLSALAVRVGCTCCRRSAHRRGSSSWLHSGSEQWAAVARLARKAVKQQAASLPKSGGTGAGASHAATALLRHADSIGGVQRSVYDMCGSAVCECRRYGREDLESDTEMLGSLLRQAAGNSKTSISPHATTAVPAVNGCAVSYTRPSLAVSLAAGGHVSAPASRILRGQRRRISDHSTARPPRLSMVSKVQAQHVGFAPMPSLRRSGLKQQQGVAPRSAAAATAAAATASVPPVLLHGVNGRNVSSSRGVLHGGASTRDLMALSMDRLRTLAASGERSAGGGSRPGVRRVPSTHLHRLSRSTVIGRPLSNL